MKKLLYFSIFMLAISPLMAQQNWSLARCVEFGIQNNITIKQRELQVQSASSTFSQSKSGRLPSVSANASQALRLGRSIDPYTNQFVEQTVNSTSASLNANWTVFNGFGREKTIQQNQMNIQANQFDVEQSKRDISLNIASAYLQVLLNQELVEVSKSQVQATKSQIARTEKLITAGTAAQNQVISLKAQLANDEMNLVNAENQVSFTKLNLMQQMNLPATPDFQIERIEVGTIVNEYDTQTPQDIYEVAQNNQMNIKGAEIRSRSAYKGIEIAQSGRIPTISLNAGISSSYSSAAPTQLPTKNAPRIEVLYPIGYLNNDPTMPVLAKQFVPSEYESNGFVNQLNTNRSTFFSLNVSIPIFTQNQIKNNVTQARIQQKNADYQTQSVRIQLRQAIEQSYNDQKMAKATLEARNSQVESLEANYKITETRLNAGLSNSTDYNLAKLNLDQAKLNVIRSKYEYYFRIKVLDFYLNKPF
jgi:outer membrane protein